MKNQIVTRFQEKQGNRTNVNYIIANMKPDRVGYSLVFFLRNNFCKKKMSEQLKEMDQ